MEMKRYPIYPLNACPLTPLTHSSMRHREWLITKMDYCVILASSSP